jgi:hypothetical protein
VKQDGDRIDTAFDADDNGRGSKLKERIELGRDGLPDRWKITGKAWMGAAVAETFERSKGMARWKTRDDQGEAAAAEALYLPKDGTPWRLALYLRVLLKTPGATLAVLPSGQIRLEKVRDIALQGSGEAATVYALWGLDLEPNFVLAQGDRFLGVLYGWRTLIAEAHVGALEQLVTLANEVSAETLARLTKEISHRVDQPIWIVGARVFDAASGKVGEPSNVVVYRGIIVGVRSDPPPAGAAIIDAEGGTLVPGLCDAHAHS